MLATLVDTSALWKIVLAAFAGGVVLTAVFGVGAVRLEALTRARARNASGGVAGNAVVVAACAAVCAAALVIGFISMTHK
jgi:UPF0716 family protein affecting phage T7 exclusion